MSDAIVVLGLTANMIPRPIRSFVDAIIETSIHHRNLACRMHFS